MPIIPDNLKPCLRLNRQLVLCRTAKTKKGGCCLPDGCPSSKFRTRASWRFSPHVRPENVPEPTRWLKASGNHRHRPACLHPGLNHHGAQKYRKAPGSCMVSQRPPCHGGTAWCEKIEWWF